MQEEDDTQPIRVQEIRRQWAVHEDEALAYRLQNEEINQHYTGNRTRNAIVREDMPKAREEQRKEEQEALEQRFQQLHLLQQQAEEDAILAKELADRYQMGLEAESLLGPGSGPGRTSVAASSMSKNKNEIGSPLASASITDTRKPERALIPGVLSHSPDEKFNYLDNPNPKSSGGVILTPSPQGSGNSVSPPGNFSNGSNGSNGGEKRVKSIMKPSSSSSRKEMFTPPLLGAAAVTPKSNINMAANNSSSPSPEVFGAAAAYNSSPSSSSSSSRLSSSVPAQAIALDPDLQNLEMELPPFDLVQKEEEKLLQEKLDEEVALKLQKEFEQMEIDRKHAVEAQDRELAKMLHQKEKERLRRAKERARMKAAAAAAGVEQSNQSNPMEFSQGPSHSPEHEGSVQIGEKDGGSTRFSPPRIPEKTHSHRLDRDDPVRFRAEAKPLPPQPLHNFAVESQSPSRRISSSRSHNSSHSHDPTPFQDPIPPYMPLQGLQNLQKKRNK